jgi:hypothetical protein
MDRHNDTENTSGRGGGAHSRGLRASDADREATATLLRQHYTEGRLDAREYDERIDRCYAAKTVRELDDLFIDLPRATTRSAERDRDRHDFRPPWRLAMIAPVVIALIVICAVTGAHHFFWLLWPLLFIVFGPFGRWYRYRRWRDDRPSSV